MEVLPPEVRRKTMKRDFASARFCACFLVLREVRV